MNLVIYNMAPYYNYYELAVQRWCTDGYQIHGLWPQINATDYPSYCEDVSYSPPSGALIDAMKENWNECGTDLWDHEWEKHGSCVKSQTGVEEESFFNATLGIFSDYFNLTESCDQQQDCVIGCFDLGYKLIPCPK
jgi:ribonuclease I